MVRMYGRSSYSMTYDEFMALPEDERRSIFDALIKLYEIQYNRLLRIVANVLLKR